MNAPGPLPFPADGHAPAGHRLGHFELRGVASRSALGIVYRAWDHELGIAVALKEYLPQDLARRDAHGQLQPQGSVAIGAFERGRDAFIDETRLLARCDHPSLLRVRQLLRAHGTVYRVMPWCQGWPLAELRREMADPPDEPALRRLLDEVLGALETWHRVGGAHGSVNPSKILLLDDDRALLLGPGLVRRAIGDAAVSPAPAASRSFLAPEQLAATAPCGPCTDFFALAQVVRYCITGMLPQPDGPAPQPLASAVEGLYFDAPHVRYDERFLRAIDAAASSNPADRPQTATEFRDWLDHGPRRAHAVPTAAAPGDVSAETARAERESEAASAAQGEAQADVAGEVDIPVDVPAPEADDTIAAPAPATTAAAAAAPAEEETVDEATVDLIRRVIESIPERHDAPQQVPPQFPQPATQQAPQQAPQQTLQAAPQPAVQDTATQSAFTEPILRVEDWADAPLPPAWPQRKKDTGMRWLLGIVLLTGAAYAAWEWGWPAWQEHMASSAASTAQAPAAPPVAPTITALPTPAASAAVAAEPLASAPEAVAPASAPAPAAERAEEPAAPPAPVPQTAASGPADALATAPASTVTTVIAGQAPPASAAPETAAPAAAPAARRSNGPESPREACGTRTQFALYRCMQQQCASTAWARHEQCVRFKATDRVE